MAKCIYFDHAASTPTAKEVVKAMQPYWRKYYGNASSTHRFGQQASVAIAKTRKLIADFLYCNSEEIIFTSGATESSNMAIKGVVNFYAKQFKIKERNVKPHLIVSAIEHLSVLESGLVLERDGYGLSIVKPASDGIVSVENIIEQINDQTVLISLMYVNNETGLIQPVQELGKRLIEINQAREKGDLPRIYFHVDAVQSFNHVNCRPDHVKVDLMSFSGHKIYGPKGTGFLYIRNKTPLLKFMSGGHHERSRRGGTMNTTGVVGLGAAVKLYISNGNNIKIKIDAISKYLYEELSKIDGIRFNSNKDLSIKSIINFAIRDVKASDLQIMFDLNGIAISNGAACASGSTQASPVLLAMGQSDRQALAGLRISLGKDNTIVQARYFIKTLRKIINRLNNV